MPEQRTVTKVLIISPAAENGSLELAGPALRYGQLADQLRRSGVETTLALRGPGGDADWSRDLPGRARARACCGGLPAGPR